MVASSEAPADEHEPAQEARSRRELSNVPPVNILLRTNGCQAQARMSGRTLSAQRNGDAAERLSKGSDLLGAEELGEGGLLARDRRLRGGQLLLPTRGQEQQDAAPVLDVTAPVD